MRIGATRAALRSRLRAALLDGAALGLAGTRLHSYLTVVDPTVPGTWEARVWAEERRRSLGRVRRRAEPWRERAGILPLETGDSP